jgi:ubiquinone/menaquinone biosynthesis C-methylase UbiE
MKKSLDALVNSYDSLAVSYDSDTDTFHHKISEYLTIQNLLNELPKKKSISILDSGGGTGKYAIFLKKLGYEVKLTDASSESVKVFLEKCKRENLNIPYDICNSESTGFEKDTFDVVMLNGGVISYTPNPDKLLEECHRILKMDGILWFDFLNATGWALETHDLKRRIELAQVKDSKLIQMPDWDYPARIFTLDYISTLLKKAGFKIKKEYGLVFISNSLPIEMRYSKNYEKKILEEYKKVELQMSRNNKCKEYSWSINVCAQKQ